MNTIEKVNFQMTVQGSETYLDLHSPFGQRDLAKGCKEMNAALSRKLGEDAKEESADLLEELQNGGKTWFIDRLDWVLNASYGSEIHYYLFNVAENVFAGKSGKSFDRALTLYAKVCIRTLALLEHPSINLSRFFKIVKQLPKETNDAIIEAARQEIINYFTTE